MDKAATKAFFVSVIRRVEGHKGFKVLPRRWVVERTFGWMTRWRRLVRHYENRIDISTAMIHVAMGACRGDASSIEPSQTDSQASTRMNSASSSAVIDRAASDSAAMPSPMSTRCPLTSTAPRDGAR